MSQSVINGRDRQFLASFPDGFLAGLLQQIEQFSPESELVLVQALRQEAIAHVQAAQLPSTKDEDWRFTDLSGLKSLSFQAVQPFTGQSQGIEALTVPESPLRLTWVNGCFSAQWSDLSQLPPGVYVGNLAQLPETQRSRLGKYLAQQPGSTEIFSALNTAGLQDIALIWVDPEVAIENPIQVLFLSGAATSSFSQPRALVVAEPGSKLTLVEQYACLGETAPYFTNAIAEIWLEPGATVNHLRLQQEGETSFHIGRSAVSQGRDSHYTCTTIDLGAKLSRHNLEVYQAGEQTATRLNGLVVVSGEQLADTHSLIALSQPYGTTDQLHKCAVGDRARTVFNGKVLVPQAAQLTNAAQLNRNLLLSPKARVDTKPELQITADNVKCSHGATVSQLEADEIFYLRSRGLDEAASRRLLVNAFVSEILERIAIASLRERLTQAILAKINA